MLGDLITRGLVLVLGYAYPAFECYKTVEKNKADIEQLRFWCQYWIIVALLTVFERIGDIFVSWLPMYGELKVAFFIYLWFPNTKGTTYVYETILHPYISKHEQEIDQRLLELRTRAWELAIQYWQNCTIHVQTAFFQILQYLAAQSSRVKDNNSQKEESQSLKTSTLPSATAFLHPPDKQLQRVDNSGPPAPPPPPTSTNRAEFQTPKSDVVQDQLPFHTLSQATTLVDTFISEDSSNQPDLTAIQENAMGETLRAARIRLRRSRPQQ